MFEIIKLNLKIGCAAIPIHAKNKDEFTVVGNELKNKISRLLGGRSLHIRQIDAGSCNGCELEISALSNPIYDIERFGIHFVASPRHADILLVTGPVTRQMEPALIKTYEATPEPRIVIATGDCAINCGVYANSYAVSGPLKHIIPVDLNIPGCPPSPTALLQALLSILDRLPKK